MVIVVADDIIITLLKRSLVTRREPLGKSSDQFQSRRAQACVVRSGDPAQTLRSKQARQRSSFIRRDGLLDRVQAEQRSFEFLGNRNERFSQPEAFETKSSPAHSPRNRHQK